MDSTKQLSITITAGLTFAAGVVQIMGSLTGYVAAQLVGLNNRLPSSPEGPLFSVVALMQEHYRVLVVIQIIFGSLLCVSAVGFYYLQAWSRLVITLLAFASAIYLIGWGVLWVMTLWPMGSAPKLLAIMGGLMTLFFSSAAIAFIVFLHTGSVADAFRTRSAV
jgi:hypothetical protein